MTEIEIKIKIEVEVEVEIKVETYLIAGHGDRIQSSRSLYLWSHPFIGNKSYLCVSVCI